MDALYVQVNGIVQGVGFRPFVARLARSLDMSGWVRNDPDGVAIHVQHVDAGLTREFVRRLQEEAPRAARIISCEVSSTEPEDGEGFVILSSTHDGSRDTLVSPDLATCPDCLAELLDPDDRRYHYPFINCTNCGPRFTIIEDLPYDRPVTSMGSFKMCPSCADEYADESDRRYHAQPNACFSCGPHLWWADGDVEPELEWATNLICSDALITRAASRLAAGAVLGVKGLGGWHLTCAADDEEAVRKLRERKHRPTKPLAIMVSDLEAARELCSVSDEEAELLSGSIRPIVLLRRREDAAIAPSIAGDLPELGIMLPSTPVQHLLLRTCGRPLVMTSGNRSGEPIIADDTDALGSLSMIADGFLGNDRRIVARYDDSVVRLLDDGTEQMVRRARGYAPAPLFLQKDVHEDDVDEQPDTPCLLACGPEQKATFCFLTGRRAYISQHLGDLEHLGAWYAWDDARQRYASLFGLAPQVLACDMHPEYLSSKWAHAQDLPLIEVQHHHAHIASVMGENGLWDRVIGVAVDGTGYGLDGTIWGCEVFLADRAGFERFWHLPTFALPGGAAAILNPRRTAYSLLCSAGLVDDPRFGPFLATLAERDLLDQMLAKGINCPSCSSLGRLFDAVSALLGLCQRAGYDGEAACLLEAAAQRELADRPPTTKGSSSAPVTDHSLAGLLAAPLTALTFHERIIDAIISACEDARATSGLTEVALSGGCMVNRIMSQGLVEGLQRRGFDVYLNRELPPNDGCIAYGQAIVAQARLLEERYVSGYTG